jgi:hypothetical protein
MIGELNPCVRFIPINSFARASSCSLEPTPPIFALLFKYLVTNPYQFLKLTFALAFFD